MRARTREGMKVAKVRGRLRGKQPKLSPTLEAHLVKLYPGGEHTISELEALFGRPVRASGRRWGGRSLGPDAVCGFTENHRRPATPRRIRFRLDHAVPARRHPDGPTPTHVESQAVQLRSLATSDELTGLPNRRGWSAALLAAIETARRDGNPLSIAMLDLDHFKRFNDELGHQAGDRLLRGAAAAWKDALRSADQLARYGGEEFIVLLHNADSDGAHETLERLRPVTPAGQTFSAGVATWTSPETSDELIARADRALYRAKRSGRNRTIVDEPVAP